MPSTLTTFRQNLATRLTRAGGPFAGYPVVNGKVDGPIERGNVLCTWSTGKKEEDSNVDLELLDVYVRVLTSGTSRSTSAKNPLDPATFEDAAELFQTDLDDVQATTTPVWYFRVVEVEVDVDRRQVTALVRGWQDNQFRTA